MSEDKPVNVADYIIQDKKKARINVWYWGTSVQTFLPRKSSKEAITYSEYVTKLRYPVRNAHVSYFNLWPVWLCSTFPHYLINGTVVGKKKLFNTKCVFWIFQRRLSEAFLILRRTERDMIINVYWSSCKVSVNLVRFYWITNFLDRLSKNT